MRLNRKNKIMKVLVLSYIGRHQDPIIRKQLIYNAESVEDALQMYREDYASYIASFSEEIIAAFSLDGTTVQEVISKLNTGELDG